MPDRIIRDELLTSERWIELPDNAERLAFVALLLTADGLGNVEAGEARLHRLWVDFGISRDQVDCTLRDLSACDLVRPYEYEGKRYLHIPRFRQSTRYTKRLHPLSPWTADEQKQALAKNSHGELPVGTMTTPSAHHVLTCRSDVGVGVGVGDGVGVEKRTHPRANGHASTNVVAMTDNRFAVFWAAYPKKRAKGDAERAWAKLKPTSELAERIMSALTQAKTSPDWVRDAGRYVPHPASWLNGKRWEDDVGARDAGDDSLRGLV